MILAMRLFLFLFVFSLAINAVGQQVQVVNSETGEPVSDVVIFYNVGSQSVITNSKGVAPLEGFKTAKKILFQHASYVNKTIGYQKLENMGFVLPMEPSNFKLNEVTIAANKWEQNSEQVPNQIAFLSRRQVDFGNAQTSADMLGQTGQVFIQKSQLGGGSPMIRGFSANAVLIVVDGVRMNNAIFRGGNLQNVINIDPNSLESAEVVFGPGSVMYGSDALGGVMDFHTMKPRLTTVDTFEITGRAMLRYASANTENTLHANINGGSKKWAFRTIATYSKFGDLTIGKSKSRNSYLRNHFVKRVNGVDSIFNSTKPYLMEVSGYEQMNFMQKVRFRPHQHFDFEYGLHVSSTSDIPRFDRLIQYNDKDNVPDTLKYAKWYYGPQEWVMNNFQMTCSRGNAFFDQARIIAAHQYFRESRHSRKLQSLDLKEQTEQVNAYSLNVDFDKMAGKTGEFFYGVEYVFNDVNSQAHQKNIITTITSPEQTRYPDGENQFQTMALYASYKHGFSQNIYLTSGVRYSHVLLSSKVENNLMNLPETNYSINAGATTGSLGLVTIIPQYQMRLAANLSSGFRAPNLDDVAKVFDSEPGVVIVPNNQLSPEYAYNADVSIQKEFGRVAYLSLTAFYTFVNNAIVRRNFMLDGQDSIMYNGELSEVKANVNTGEATIYGVSADARVFLVDGLSIRSSANWIHGRDDAGEPLRHVAPFFATAHVTFEQKKLMADFYVKYNGKLTHNNMAPTEKDKNYMYALDGNGQTYSPAWETFNFNVQYQINSCLLISAGVENIFDRQYRPYSSGIPAPGRNIILSMRYRF
jgi:hemoglobin/transferrin/lactoferrin receptor protein